MAKRHKNRVGLGGKKRGGTHTTLIDAAEVPVRIASKIPGISRIAPGFIKSGLRAPSSGPSVKIIKETGCLLLNIRGNTSVQDVRVYHGDLDFAEAELNKKLRKAKVQVR